jgi:hypothetical protein
MVYWYLFSNNWRFSWITFLLEKPISLIRGGLFVFKEINIDTLILEEYK